MVVASSIFNQRKGPYMAETKNTRSYVAGFLKRVKYNKEQRVMTFVVAKQSFVLPSDSSFGVTIQDAELCNWNVLVLFEGSEYKHPRVLGIITKPLWAQVDAASKGDSFETIKALLPEGRALN